MASRSPEFSQFRCRSTLRHRSRSAANINPRSTHADASDVDADFDWDMRRSSANNALSSRISTWLQRRLMTFGGGGAARYAYGRELRTATKAPAPTPGANDAANERPLTAHGSCTAAAAASPVDVLELTSSYDSKCVSCPELADSVSDSAGAPVDRQRCDVADKSPAHQAVRKTCSDTGFQPAAATDVVVSVDKASMLSVPAVFVTSYTRSLPDQHPSSPPAPHPHPPHQHHQHHQHHHQQQQQERRQSASFARQRLISMSDSLLGSSDSSTPPATARIWKVTEFLCIGNAAAAADDRLLCRHSVFGLVDLCVGGTGASVSRGSGDRWAPCNCGDQRRHRRAVLRLNVSRTDLTDVRSCFPTINRFVDGFRRRPGDPSSSGCVMVYCETGDTLSVLAAAQYLVAVENQTVDEIEKCLSQAGCVTPLFEGFTAVLHSIYNQRSNLSPVHHHHHHHHHHHQQQQQQQQQPEHVKPNSDVVVSGMESPASRRRRLARRRSETTILDSKSMRPVMMVEAWPDKS